jgi:alpha/beta superfamily hydrolase
MFITEERVNILLNTLNKAVTMLLEACNVNKTQDEILQLKNVVKNNNSNHKQQKRIKNIHFIQKKKCSHVKSHTTNKLKITRTMRKILVKRKRLD